MKLHPVDGTYELFRAYFAMPPLKSPNGLPVGAVRGLVRTLLVLLRQTEVTHLACAFDSEVLSFRNELFAGYKTGEGTPEDLLAQFELAERAVAALGIAVWPMVEFEADDAIATAAAKWRDDPAVDQIVICSPDKDLAQMVQGKKVVALDRRKDVLYDEATVLEKFGVLPQSIPDYLGLVGDAADGIPGIPKWGAKTAASLLRYYQHIEEIPDSATNWQVEVRGAEPAATSLSEHRDEALFYRQLATLRTDVDLPESLEQLEWRGIIRADFEELCGELGFSENIRPEEWRCW